MRNNILIFDFDGTIADTLHYLVAISNRLSTQFGFKFIEPEEVSLLKDKTTMEVIEYLGVPFMKIPKIVAVAKAELHKEITTVEPIEGLKEILFQIKELGNNIGVLSSNSAENVKKFLQKHEIDVFDFISSTTKIWSKNTSLLKLIRNNGFEPEEIIYIGDETRDIDAARKAGVRIAAVSWGYNSHKTLESCNPDFLLEEPSDLIKLLSPMQP